MQGIISLKTSSTNAPVVNITTMVALQPALVATPAQLYLPPAPLVGARTLALSIVNNGTNKVALSDAMVNVKDVTVEIKDTSPGTYFNLSIKIPDGFELPPGQFGQLTVKSTHPQFPVIRVPIYQPARPTPPRAIAKATTAPPPMAAPPPIAAPPQPVTARPLTRPPGVARPTLPPPLPPPLPGT